MKFKDSPTQFQLVDLALIEPDAGHARQNADEGSLKGLSNSIRQVGLIHPLVVRPTAGGRFTVIAGERRRQAALLAGEQSVPVLVRDCAPDEALAVQVFENIGLGVRAPLEPRDMANAIQAIVERFATPEEAASYFARPPTWLDQATAAARLSEKVTALLDAGKISSTGAAVQLEKLAKKNEASADSLIDQIERLPEGEKVSKKVVDNALSAESPRRRKTEEAAPLSEPVSAGATADLPPWEDAPAPAAQPAAPRSRVNPGKVKLVAELLGLDEDDEEELLVRLIDEFLALKRA
ncbi:MAG: chromosome partitioning protein ParB [Betaproteobacteria bacterium HGW-Betaproteobacteria-12]|nr:MAG: chromosome partitioning protein ParB [Betaproteobacteria bacterium HGW-Betaproteobacteria-12]